MHGTGIEGSLYLIEVNTPMCAEVRAIAVAATLPAGPGIVKDFVKSRKHDWDQACYLPDLADTTAVHHVVSRFVELQVDLTGQHAVHRTCGHITCTFYLSRKMTEKMYNYFVRHGWVFAGAGAVLGGILGALMCEGNQWCILGLGAIFALWAADLVDVTDSAHLDHKCVAIKTTTREIGYAFYHDFGWYMPLYPEEVGGKNCQKK